MDKDSDSHFDTDDLLFRTATIVSAYVQKNAVSPSELSRLIKDTHKQLLELASPAEEPAPSAPIPAVPIRKSVTPDYLICLEDGKRFKSLKRHLTGLGLTPDDYRAKWGLPDDYPMVAPNYTAVRSKLALKSGLGTKTSRTDKEE